MSLHQCDCINEGTLKPCAYPNSCGDESEEDSANDTPTDTGDDLEILAEKIKGIWLPPTSLGKLNKQPEVFEKKPAKPQDSTKHKENKTLESINEVFDNDKKVEAPVDKVGTYQSSLASLKKLNEQLEKTLGEMSVNHEKPTQPEEKVAVKVASDALDGDGEVEILGEKINTTRPSSVSSKKASKRPKTFKKKSETRKKPAKPDLEKPSKLASNTSSSDNEIEILTEKTSTDRSPPASPTNANNQIDAAKERLEENKSSTEPAPNKTPETMVVPIDDKKLESCKGVKPSLWDRIQEFKAASKQLSTTESIIKKKKQRKLLNSSEDPELQKLAARMEMMKLNHEFTRALNNFLYSKNFFPNEAEDFIVMAREVVLSRWWSMSSRGIHVILFSEGFSDRIHPCYWGNVLDENLLEKLHEQTGRVNQTIFAVEKGVCGEDIVKLSELSEGEVNKKEVGSQCIANFQHKRIFAKIYKYSGTMHLIQEGHGKRMTCYFDQITLAHSHKKEVWCQKYNL